jgi:hypothetical protein
MDQQTQLASPEKGNGKIWLIILALVILVGIILFFMKLANAPMNPEVPN